MKDDPLPDFLKLLFWDTNFDCLRVPGHERYIIERVLEYGDDSAVGWLWHTFGQAAIADVIQRSRKLSRNTATLWALVLEIPKDRIACLSRPYQLTPKVF